MAKVADAPEGYRRRLGEAAGSLGHPLREIEGQEVVVTGLAFESGRKVKSLNPEAKGQMVAMDCAIIIVKSSDPHGTRYFTFSPSLVEKLRTVDPDELPMDARFVKIDLTGGQSVWNVE